MRKFLPGSDGELIKQPLTCSVLTRCIVMKTKHPVHIMVFGVVSCDGDVMPPFIFLHGLNLNIEAYIKCLQKIVLLWIERVAA